ncbi:MAG: FAD binding domain-containing protein [Nitrososphaerota archaeon]|nr:FAD binding domain-containing protein [Nitrososphaerota archaeon]
MLRLPKFEYLSPATVEEAVRILAEAGPDAALVAGGTDLFPRMMRRQREPRLIVSAAEITSLRGIRGDAKDGLTVGPNTTLAQLSAEHAIRKHYPALSEAAACVASPQIRSAGTVGGNLLQETRCTFNDESYWWRQSSGPCLKSGGSVCHVAAKSARCWAVSSSDLAPVAVAMGAVLSFAGPKGTRVVPAGEFYSDDGINPVKKSSDEILIGISFPSAEGLLSTYLKLRRRGAVDFPLMGVAAVVRVDGRGTCLESRVVVGGIASWPLAVPGVDAILRGRELSPVLIDEVASAAYEAARPMDNADLTLLYRKTMVREYVGRALRGFAHGSRGFRPAPP